MGLHLSSSRSRFITSGPMLDAPAPSSTKRKQSKCTHIGVLPRVGLRSSQRPRTWEYRKVTIAAPSPEFNRAVDIVDHPGQARPTLPTVSLQTTSEDNKTMWTLEWSIMLESKSGGSLAYAGVWHCPLEELQVSTYRAASALLDTLLKTLADSLTLGWDRKLSISAYAGWRFGS
ncbi:hypothetical protein BDP55DRAFT_637244 [Colletotrichum godetiae]|uniref:Uncharacterized protein n=1 Tax=Colletotrichum godetiae TaxID=1209918 RepID=A0AAJ0A9K4_9PEZI|nr:uncharacterized protein BDP55DRAFT_637244 [Colletotrichum godetiae]KAK1659053.1 hypothetical protein BDP55DRAFT_637244 [Colletotrichum godetiae]